jgi:hypothetical protein
MKIFCSAMLLLFTLSFTLSASDRVREWQYDEAFDKSLKQGEKVILKASNEEFLGIFLATESVVNKGTVILLHDAGSHPDQQRVIHEMRTEFPEHGWASLSLQMPLREAGVASNEYFSLFSEANIRIQAGIEYLQNSEVENIVLLGYRMGALMALHSQAEKLPSSLKAIIAISLPVPENAIKSVQTLKILGQLQIPLLDIFAGEDLPDVKRNGRKKRLAANQNPQYRQMNIATMDHRFLHDQGLLFKRIYSWLTLVLGDV